MREVKGVKEVLGRAKRQSRAIASLEVKDNSFAGRNVSSKSFVSNFFNFSNFYNFKKKN